MKREVEFLRETAEKLRQLDCDYNIPIEAWKAAIVHRAEFLAVADEIENPYKLPKIERQAIQQLPKALAPQKEFAASVELKFQRHGEESIAVRSAQKRVEPLRIEQRREVLILKDLPDKKPLILKGLINIESANVLRDEEKAQKVEIVPKPLKTKREVIQKPERAPRVKKEEGEINLDRLIKLQRGRCAYCFRLFGDRIFLKRKIITLHATREHFVPESVGGKIVFAACQMCNIFKRDYLFDSIYRCRKYLAGMWNRSGYQDAKGHFLADGAMFSKN